jgi:hypothetical protein
MAWIESHQSLARHPKTLRLAQALESDTVVAVGHLHFLWWWALDYAPSGSLKGVSDAEVASACQYKGDPTRFVQALTSAGFLNRGRTLHDWHDYTGRLLDRRRAKAASMRQARAKASATSGQRGHHVETTG